MGLKVTDLAEWCRTAIKEGYGDRIILVAGDDEGNSYKQLYRGFSLADEDMFNSSYSPMLYANIKNEDVSEKAIILE